MANPKSNPTEDITKSANQTADHLEEAVRSGNKESYTKAMSEVNTFRDKHTLEETKAYTVAVTKRLEDDKVLPTVSLFDTQVNFKRIDIGNNGRLERNELELYENRKDVNEVQAALTAHIRNNYDKIRMISQYGESWGFNSDAIADQDIDDGVEQQRAIMNLHAPGKDGVSLYDRMQKDADGNIVGGTFSNSLNADKSLARTLTTEDKQTIETLQKNQPFWSFNDFNKDALNAFEKQSGLDPAVVQNQKRAARVTTDVPIELPERQERMQQLNTIEQNLQKGREEGSKERINDLLEEFRQKYNNRDLQRDALRYDRTGHDRYGYNRNGFRDSYDDRDGYPSRYRGHDADREQDGYRAALRDIQERHLRERANEQKINEALTVQSGKSYAHSAEKLLALAGNSDPSSKELKEVSHQLWVADQKRKSGGLTTGQVLHLDANLRSNPSLAKLFDGTEL